MYFKNCVKLNYAMLISLFVKSTKTQIFLKILALEFGDQTRVILSMAKYKAAHSYTSLCLDLFLVKNNTIVCISLAD